MSGYIGSKASVTLVDGYNRTEADAEFVQDPNGAITVSGSNVGIGTDSPEATLTVDGQTILGDGVAGSANLTNLTSGTPPQLIAGWSVPVITWTPSSATEAVFTRDGSMQIDILAGANNFSNINFSDPDDEDVGQISYAHSTDAMRFRTSTTERMRIDSAGRVTTPYQPVFDVAYSGAGYGLKNPVIFDAVFSNVGGHYNTSTGRFTAPVSGSYIFYTTFIKNNASGTARRRFEKNDTDPLDGRHLRMDSGTNFGDNGTMQAIIYLSAGDYVTVAHTEGSSYGRPDYDYFGGYLIG